MRNKLALTIAVVSFALATALGVGLAGAEPASVESAAPRGVAPPPSAPSPASLPVCSNGLDDDGDGLLDLEDPGCLGDPNGASEEAAPTPPATEAEAAPIEAPAP